MDDWERLLESLVELPLEDRPDAARTIADVCGERIAKVYRRIVSDGEKISDASPAEDFHELRKTGKELRYLLELFGVQLFDDDVVGPLIDSLKDLQELLGRHQDREVQVAMVRSLTSEVAPRPGGGAACLAMGTLVARLRDDELAARRAFAESFAELASPDAARRGRRSLRLSGPVAGRRYDPRMGYKLLGFIVWQGIKLYMRNSHKGTAVKAALAGVGALAVAGAVLAGRRAVKQDQ